MKLVTLKGTQVLNLDPLNVAGRLNEVIIFQNHVTRSLWFMLEQQDGSEPSTRDCIVVLNQIQSSNASNPEELEAALRACLVDIPDREAIQQLFDAITEVCPIQYRIMTDGPKQTVARL